MSRFEIGEHDFLLDDEPLRILSGALHYFRVHPDQWADRIRKARAMGLNTIETYVAWNFHAPERGRFDLDGQRDLGRFLDLVAAEGMYAIVRPGPFICAEWDNGGLPAWLLATPGVGVRRNEPLFLAAVGEYLDAVLPLVAERQVTRGGNVLLVQVENEYGAYGDDKEYLRTLVAMNRERGIDVPLITCDQANDEMLARGGLPELLRTATFGSRTTARLATLREHQPTGPLVCMEFWDGWFDSWGRPHHTTTPEDSAHDLDDLLAAGGSVNLYMFHGGTNFGLTNGANHKGQYLPITTSYDYDAPLSEHGAPTAKYRAFQKVVGRYAPVPELDVPEPGSAPELEVRLGTLLPLAQALPAWGPFRTWDHLPTADEVGQWSGFTLYRTALEADDAVVTFASVRDRAVVSLDDEPVGTISRAERQTALAVPARAGVLDLLVEDQGRVNYGPRIGEPKGLIGPAHTAARELRDWQTLPLALDELPGAALDALRTGAPTRDGVAGPALVRGTFGSTGGMDHFLRLDGWTKGLVWVNGTLLGRYWSMGPTGTLYVPGPVVREANEIVVLELHAARHPVVRFVAEPDLGHTEE